VVDAWRRDDDDFNYTEEKAGGEMIWKIRNDSGPDLPLLGKYTLTTKNSLAVSRAA
jgi:hypothetical protein